MNGVIVIVAYRPKPGKETDLLELVRNRVPTLRKEGLVTDRKPTIMRARDGTIIEVSEWKSPEAIDAARTKIRTSSPCGTSFSSCVIASRLRICWRPRKCSLDLNQSETDFFGGNLDSFLPTRV
jgi:quinol monooxygenase YgiN